MTMNDYEILKHLGLEIRDQSVDFYDDDSIEHILKINEIKDISFEKAFIPIQNKLGFWIEKLFVQRGFWGFFNPQTYNEDYRKIYELEIELNDHRVLSRKVKNPDVFECQEVIEGINKLIL